MANIIDYPFRTFQAGSQTQAGCTWVHHRVHLVLHARDDAGVDGNPRLACGFAWHIA